MVLEGSLKSITWLIDAVVDTPNLILYKRNKCKLMCNGLAFKKSSTLRSARI